MLSLRLAPCLLLSLMLSACSDRPPMLTKMVEVKPPEVPANLLTCQDEPQAPQAGDLSADWAKVVGLFVTDLGESGRDCRRNLAAVAKIVKEK